MKKFLCCLLAALMVLSLLACGEKKAEAPAATEAPKAAEPVATEAPAKEPEAAPTPGIDPVPEPTETVILFTNDVHCGYNLDLGYTGIAAIKKSFASMGKGVILADCGDAVQGDTIGTLSKGDYIIDIMNQVGYDVATFGNHEFDYGMDVLKGLMEKANFPYVSCNFTDLEGNTIVDPYVILEAAGKKIAFIGVTTPKTFVSSTPTYFQDGNGNYIYSFAEDDTGDKLAAAIQKAADDARGEGADYVIALSHLGIEADCEPYTSSEMITKTSGINAFLDAHSHSVIEGEKVQNLIGEDVLLMSTGTKLDNVGCLIIAEDGSFTAGLVGASKGLLTDPETDAFIKDIEAKFSELQNKVVAHTDVDLAIKDPATGERMVRSNETNLGDVCADAYRILSGADIGIVNGGGIRDSIPAGDITFGQIIKVHPFGNAMCVVETSGQEVLDALELSASKLPGEFGGFLQVSGMTFTIDLNVDSTVELNEKSEFVKVAGARRVKDVEVLNRETGEYEPIDPEKTYTLACHNYKLKSGGDGYTMFKDNVFLQDEVMLDNQVLINYIVDVLGGTVGADYADVYGQGRITILEKDA